MGAPFYCVAMIMLGVCIHTFVMSLGNVVMCSSVASVHLYPIMVNCGVCMYVHVLNVEVDSYCLLLCG